ncbi:MAG: macro domain-containing protein [Alphaproteobacteria bacterium]|nr:macro domain-containing protein [Alphaproteobacteria bacterium]
MDIIIPKRKEPSNPYLNRITLVKGDISAQNVDAVVSIIPKSLEYHGSVNASLLEAAGEQLDEFILNNVYRPRSDDIYVVPGFNLPCKFLIFCIVPEWRNDFDRKDRDLLAACRGAIEMAQNKDMDVIAFPPLASGKNAFPKKRAARLIIRGISDRLDGTLKEVRIVSPDQNSYDIFKERLI